MGLGCSGQELGVSCYPLAEGGVGVGGTVIRVSEVTRKENERNYCVADTSYLALINSAPCIVVPGYFILNDNT